MVIRKLSSDSEKAEVAGQILEALPDWFGIPEARAEYIADSRATPFSAPTMGTGRSGFFI